MQAPETEIVVYTVGGPGRPPQAVARGEFYRASMTLGDQVILSVRAVVEQMRRDYYRASVRLDRRFDKLHVRVDQRWVEMRERYHAP